MHAPLVPLTVVSKGKTILLATRCTALNFRNRQFIFYHHNTIHWEKVAQRDVNINQSDYSIHLHILKKKWHFKILLELVLPL